MSNQVAAALLGTRSSFPANAAEFVERHIHPNGRPWSWAGHEYARALIADTSETIVVQKAAQMIVSTIAITRLLQWCTAGYKVGYYLPDRDFMGAFVQDRVDPVINADALLSQATLEGKSFEHSAADDRQRRKGADNLRIKHIGAGSAWFMGLQKLKDVKSVDLDAFIADEVDELKPEFADWMADRIMHSQFRREFWLSQPSVPDWGISERYNLTDQKVYLHTCPRCHKEHCLEDEWPECLVAHVGRTNLPVNELKPDREDLAALDWRIVCLHCGARLRGVPNVKARWVARHPGRAASGYRLSQLYGAFMSPARLATRWLQSKDKPSKRANFTISILGLPHPGDRQPVTDEIFSAACQDWALSLPAYRARHQADSPQPLLLAGIDQGDLLHVVLGGFDGEHLDVADLLVLQDDWERLALLLRDVDCFVIDALPNKSSAKRLLRADGLNGAMNYLNSDSWSVGYEEKDNQIPLRVVKDDRTTAIDEMADAITAGTIRFPAPKFEVVQLCKRHMKALVKDHDLRTNKMTYARAVENHFGLATTYLWMAYKLAIDLGLGPRAPLGDVSSFTTGASIVRTRRHGHSY